jgi:hypothetical protein
MPTPNEYRHMEEVVLKLASETTEPYAKEALLDWVNDLSPHRRALAYPRSHSCIIVGVRRVCSAVQGES